MDTRPKKQRMSTKEIDNAAWRKHPFSFRNNRGGVKTAYGGYITFGIPEPPKGRREKDSDLKGGDRIGWEEVKITPDMVGKTVAVFLSIEIKGPGDRLKAGQIHWHNKIIEHGGISEIWTETERITEKLKNKK